MSTTTPKPTLLFTAHPLTGHITPLLRIASHLSKIYPIYFLAPTSHRAAITSNGLSFLPLLGRSDINDTLYYSPSAPPIPHYYSLSWQKRGCIDFQNLWIDTIPDAWRSLVSALELLRDKEVVLVVEAMFWGVLPLFYGADLPEGIRRPASVGVSVTVPFVKCEGVPPAFVDSCGNGEGFGDAEWERGWEVWDRCTAHLRDSLKQTLKEVGCVTELEGEFLSGQNYWGHEKALQLGVEGMFRPRKWSDKLRFVGVLPVKNEPEGGWKVPDWWEDVKGERKVVVVAQGTVEVDPEDLILPTLRGLDGRDDVLVVAILGRRGATLPGDFSVPANARIADYLSYEAVLPWAHVWVHNGGYGAVQHGIAHGVPMVVAGEGQDKTENAKLVEFSGAGLNLGRVPPSTEQVRQAVDAVLDGVKFRARAKELSEESAEQGCFEAIESEILTVWRRRSNANPSP
ncbi:hypothetical protein OQA88_10624 [Cercophora sp. LCS_1]